VADGLAQQAILLWQKAQALQKAAKIKRRSFFMVIIFLNTVGDWVFEQPILL
jgi:hypothetical protein